MNGSHDPDPTGPNNVAMNRSLPGRAASHSSRPRMKFVEGGRAEFSDETATLLRTRLQAVALVLSMCLSVAFVVNLFSGYEPLPVLRGLILAVFVASYLTLRGRQAFVLAALRWLEAGLFLAWIVQMLLMLGARLTAAAADHDAVGLIAGLHFHLSAWAMFILTYGILMPNTWQRALAILVPTACLPYVLMAFLRWQVPALDALYRAARPNVLVPMPLMAALIAVYGAYVVTAIRHEAFKGKRLGQYVLKQRLGAGGMGEVYAAEHQLLKRPCAVKFIKPGGAVDAAVLARFEREVQATARLTHWNTVEIYDYGHADDGTFYYVMELLPGLNLDELVRRHGPLPAERAVHFLRQVCRALREAHAKGLIHRDIKPANVIAAERGGVYDVAKLLDFGLVRERATAPADVRLTQPGMILGSPQYMCPEQIHAYERMDARSDIYSLGAVAYYLVTGLPPFAGNDIVELILAHRCGNARLPTEVNPSVPADLEQVILRCMARLPENRYQDVESLEQALAACHCAGAWSDQQAASWWQAHAK